MRKTTLSGTNGAFRLEGLESRQLLSVSFLGGANSAPAWNRAPSPAASAPLFHSTHSTAKATPARKARASAAAPLTITGNADVTSTPGNEMEAQVAINPTDPNNVVSVSFTDVNHGAAVTIRRSFDGGHAWSVMSWGSDQDGFGVTPRPDARVAFDAYGNLYVAYTVAVSRTQINVVVIRSTDGGASFFGLASAVGSPNIDPDAPWLTTGQSSAKKSRQAIWISFTDYASHRLMIVGATSSGLGSFSGWGTPQRVSDSWGSYSNVAVGPNGQVAVAWQSGESGQGPNQIMFDVDAGGTGARFGKDRTVTTTNVGGWDYIPAQPDRSIDAEVKLAFDNSGSKTTGRLYLTYTNEIGDESNNTDIYVTSSDNFGASWSKQIRVNDDATRSSQFLPTLAVDQTTGAVGLSWLDARNSPQNNTAQLYATVSLDHGLTFAPNVRVSAGTSNQTNANPSTDDLDYGDNGGMAFYGGRMIPVWSDNSNAAGGNPEGPNSKFDVYSAVINVNA